MRSPLFGKWKGKREARGRLLKLKGLERAGFADPWRCGHGVCGSRQRLPVKGPAPWQTVCFAACVVQLYICCIIASVEIVIDTSAILAVIGEQPEKSSLVRLSRGATLVAPASVHWEVGNALSAMFKRKAIGIKEALQLLEAYAEIPIRMVDVGLKQAVELSEKLNVYAYDAYVLACAVNQRAPLLTLDGGLRERAGELNLDVLEADSP